MPIDIKIDTRIAKIEVLEQDGSLYKVKIDNRVYRITSYNVCYTKLLRTWPLNKKV